MSENLKVNSKSSILEFKRKHNLLVDGVSANITVSNITSLNNEQLNSLKCGDIVCKQDNTGKHSYVVTYKKENVGICLSYFDASVVETVSYDYIGGNWVYNSTDISELGDITPEEIVSALLGQDVVVKTLNQTQPNKSFNITPGGLYWFTHIAIYERAFILNNMLYIILSYTISNNDAETHGSEYALFNIEVDEETGNKIYCTDGTKLNTEGGNGKLISGFPAYRGAALSNYNGGDIRKAGKNILQVSIATQSINAGASTSFEGRNFISLF